MREFSESYPLNNNMTGFKMVFRNLCVLVLRTKIASALEGLSFEVTCFPNF